VLERAKPAAGLRCHRPPTRTAISGGRGGNQDKDGGTEAAGRYERLKSDVQYASQPQSFKELLTVFAIAAGLGVNYSGIQFALPAGGVICWRRRLSPSAARSRCCHHRESI